MTHQYDINCPCGSNNIHLTGVMDIEFARNADTHTGVKLKGWCEAGCLVDVHLFHSEGNLYVDVTKTGDNPDWKE